MGEKGECGEELVLNGPDSGFIPQSTTRNAPRAQNQESAPGISREEPLAPLKIRHG